MTGILSDPTLRAQTRLLFNDYELLRYVGEREQLYKEFVNVWHRIVFGVFSDIGDLVKSLTGIDLTGGKTAKEVFAALEKQENRQVLATKLLRLQAQLQSKKRLYDNVDVTDEALLSKRPPADSLICVDGCLATRSAILEFFPAGAPQLGDGEAWFLVDGPPNLIHKDNPRFKGNFLILDLEPGFDQLFDNQAPFFPGIGWYPFVRITGYFRTASPQTRNLPALSPALIEYRSPKGYLEVSRSLASRLEDDLGPQPYESSDRLESLTTKTWLAPVIYAVHKQPPGSVPAELRPLLVKLRKKVGSAMSKREAIAGFYDAL